MRDVFRSTAALCVLGVVLVGCYNSADNSPKGSGDGGEADNTVLAGSSKVVLTVEGMA